MQKTAKPGERGILNRIREMSNFSGKAAENFFNPQFKAVMEEIRAKDDEIRSIVTGTKIGNSGSPADGKALKDLLKQAKSSFNRREYLTGVSDLSLFHKKIKQVIESINSIKNKVDEVHHDFLFKGLKDEHLDELQDLRKRFAKQQEAAILKEAGVIDFLKNIGTSRGRALAAWEKRYPNEVKKIRDGGLAVLDKSQSMLDVVFASLKEMASARSVRNPDNYMAAAAKIEKAFMAYENGKGGFKEYHNNTLKEWFEKLDKIKAKEEAEGKALNDGFRGTPVNVLENKGGPAGTTPDLTMPPVPGGGAAPASSGLSMPSMPQSIVNVTPGASGTDETSFPPAPPSPRPETMTGIGPSQSVPPARVTQMYGDLSPAPASGRQTQMFGDAITPAPGSAPGAGNTPVVPSAMTPEQREEFRAKIESAHGITANHKSFYKSLEKLGGENPLILAAYIAKYARAIQKDDPETSLHLFKIVKNIKG